MILRAFFLGITILLSASLFAQSYSNDKEKFIKEFQKTLNEYGRGDFQEFTKNVLPDLLLETSDFPGSYFSKMVETCNLMEEKKLKPYPEIYNYVYSVAAFVKSKQSQTSYDAWHSSIDKMLDSRTVKKFSDFIELSAGFFSESLIASSSNFDWFYIGGQYTFEYDEKPFINFSGGNLVCRVQSNSSKNKGEIIDSLEVIGTTGTYDPLLKKWEGNGGKITWEKVGLPKLETFAVIERYDLSLRSSTFRADSVAFKTPYFSAPIGGSLSDRAFKINREEDKIYPQFLSFERKLLIENIIKDVDYVGGFAMQGSSFVGAGTNEEQAQITYKRKGAPFITASSKEIFVSPKKVSIQKAKVSMLLNTGDSLTHEGVNFLYDLEKKNIQLTRSKSGVGGAPFQDSYHQLDIYVPKITWEIESDNIYFTYEFGTSQEQKVASFESKAFFDSQIYDQLQAMASVHPLVAISNYCYKYDEYILSEGTAATALGMTVSQATSTLLTLSNMGFINYDTEAKTVTINKKLDVFVKAKAGTIDYDNIVFTADFRPKELRGYSEDQIKNDSYLQEVQALYKEQNEARRILKNFGMMNLTTLDLDIDAIDYVTISTARNTIVFPENSTVKVKQNRDFSFSGWINSGKLEIDAKAAKFQYEDYKIKLLSTDKSLFRVRPIRKEDGVKSIPMVSRLTGISGEILIDDPNNRAGIKKGHEHYPQLISLTSSNIFYNMKDLYMGSYDSTRFYYTIEPFELDSLNDFKEKAFRLKGELVSAGIFPTIKKELEIMPDYSFGFSTRAPAGGYKFYGMDAKYGDDPKFNKIVLSRNGLQGSGKINFIHSTSISKSLIFLPDSTIGYAQFENKEITSGFEFPDVKAEEAYISYIPREKVLKVKSVPTADLKFFNGDAKLRGTAIVTPKGMTGVGLMTLKGATLVSDDFTYLAKDIHADTSSFNLKNDMNEFEEGALAFKTQDVKADVSFVTRKGVFKSNEGESTVEFPVNQYLCKMDMFTWFMDELTIEMEKSGEKEIAINQGVDRVGSNFFSIRPGQDSLQFRAPKAQFDLKNKTIYCDEVEYVDIADARIYPDSMKLVIRKNAAIDKLQDAKIVANYVTKYHHFIDAEVELMARNLYSANAHYPYYDKDSNLFYIRMDRIGLDTSYQTIASGKIAADMDFKLSAEFDYYGDVAIHASSPTISFSGATRINHSCEKFDRNWMAFTSEIDPKNIQIPVSTKMEDLEGNPISAGIVWHDSPATDSIKVYPTFLSALVSDSDPIVMTSSGYLQYNPGSKEFEIASREKLINRGEKGNYLALHTESCSMNGDGLISLGMDYGEVKIDAVGVVNYNQATGETSMNITARFDLPIDKGIMQDIASRINEVEGLNPMDFGSTTLEQALIEWEGVKAADKVKDEFIRLGEMKKVPESIDRAMTITGLRLSSFDKKSSRENGLITNVESAVLVNMYGKPVMKYIPFKGFFELAYSKSGSDKFMTYINIPGGRDYFFHYSMVKKDGTFRMKSGDEELMSTLTGMKEDKRKSKNFLLEATENSVYLAKFMEFFQK